MRLTCCDVRKVRPLVKGAARARRVVTGLRRDQWATRSNIRKIELDHDHGGLVKVNPLADWTDEEVVGLYPPTTASRTTRSTTRVIRALAARRAPDRWSGGKTRAPGAGGGRRDGPKECGMHCAVETGGFEHELEVLVGHGQR